MVLGVENDQYPVRTNLSLVSSDLGEHSADRGTPCLFAIVKSLDLRDRERVAGGKTMIVPDVEVTRQSLLDYVGDTPLVRLRRLAERLPAEVWVKVESLNPGGSIKDRVGIAMIEEAEREGWLGPGGTIIEATAGNTGVGLAMAAAVKGYRCIFVLPDKMSGEKIRLLKAYGAEIVITPTAVAPTRPRATTASPTAWPARSPAPGGPTSSPTWPTPRSTTGPPARRSGSRPRGGSRRSWPASAPAAPSPGSAATSRSRTRRSG